MSEVMEKMNEWQCIAGMEKDVEFASLRQSGLLTWYPMIGKDYFQQPADKRILIVGESVYADWKNPLTQLKETPETLAKNPDHVRFNVYNHLGDSGFYRNIVRTIVGMCPAGKQRRQFWENVSFLDLIQTAMKDALQHPTPEQGMSG